MADETQDTQTDAPTPAEGIRLGSGPSGHAHLPGKPLEKGGAGKALVRTRYPVDLFEHNVKGVDPITGSGVEVDRSKLGALLDAAAEVDLELEEVEV